MAESSEMLAQLDALPQSLRYGARQLQIRITRNTNILPVGQDNVSSSGSGTVRFRFPSASIINLSSASISFNTTLTGLVVGSSGAAFVNALIPASYKYIKRCQFFLGGVSVAGSLSNNYNQIYHAMMKCVGNNQFTQSKVIEGYTELTELYDDFGILNSAPAATSKSCYQQIDDFLLLAKGNGNASEMMIDTSIWNDLECQLDFDNNSILSVFADAGAASTTVQWALSNLRLNVDVISSIPSIYAQVIELRAAQSTPIRLVFQNLVSQVQVIQNTTRLQISSGCIDGLMVCGLVQNFNDYTPFTGNVSASETINATNPPKFNFTSGLNSRTTALTGFSAIVQVGSANYPSTAYSNALLLADSTMNYFWNASMAATSLLYLEVNLVNSTVAGADTTQQGQYVQQNYLDNQFIWVQSFSLENGWQSSQKVLSGIDTSSQNTDVLVITSGLANGTRNFLLVGLLSSVLVYDTVARTVSVIQ